MRSTAPSSSPVGSVWLIGWLAAGCSAPQPEPAAPLSWLGSSVTEPKPGFPEGQAIPLDKVRQKSGKWVYAWAIEGDIDPDSIVSNTVEIVWPPRSGRRIQVPEIDRVSWCSLEVARERLNPAQVPFLDRLVDSLAT